MAKDRYRCYYAFLSFSCTDSCPSVDKFVPGNYAVSVYGKLPEETEEYILSQGITLRKRDGTE